MKKPSERIRSQFLPTKMTVLCCFQLQIGENHNDVQRTAASGEQTGSACLNVAPNQKCIGLCILLILSTYYLLRLNISNAIVSLVSNKSNRNTNQISNENDEQNCAETSPARAMANNNNRNNHDNINNNHTNNNTNNHNQCSYSTINQIDQNCTNNENCHSRQTPMAVC